MLHDASLEKRVNELNARFDDSTAQEIISSLLNENLLGKSALVSSFGAESAVLLHMASEIRKDIPVLFVDTEFLFPETMEYLRTLAIELNLEDIRRIMPDPGRIASYDPNGDMHKNDPDQCCYLRKTAPLQRALNEFSNWITGRKRYQSGTRRHLPIFELDNVTNRVKVNPLVNWNPEMLKGYMVDHKLPPHPLIAKGYASIGCAPCTTPVREGEDPRAGRWRDSGKEECGIHFVDGKMQRTKIEEAVL